MFFDFNIRQGIKLNKIRVSPHFGQPWHSVVQKLCLGVSHMHGLYETGRVHVHDVLASVHIDFDQLFITEQISCATGSTCHYIATRLILVCVIRFLLACFQVKLFLSFPAQHLAEGLGDLDTQVRGTALSFNQVHFKHLTVRVYVKPVPATGERVKGHLIHFRHQTLIGIATRGQHVLGGRERRLAP